MSIANSNVEYLIWLDVETTGVDIETALTLEIGGIITNMAGDIIGESYSSLVDSGNFQQLFDSSHDDVKRMHEDNGLWLDLWDKKKKNITKVDEELCQWLDNNITNINDSILYFAGNSITLDRNIIKRDFPLFYKKISHRSMDVTSLSLYLKSKEPYDFSIQFNKTSHHRALSDCYLSLKEYKYYMSI